MEIKKLQELFEKEFTSFKELLQLQDKEIKQNGETTKATADSIVKTGKSIEDLQTEMKAAQDKVEKDSADQAKRLEEIEKKLGRIDYPGPGGEEVKSPGEMFTESDAYKNMVANNQYTSGPMKVKDLFSFEKKALVTSAITGGNLAQALRVPEIIMPPMRVLRIRDLLSVRGITTNAIEYVEETGFVNAAAPVAEGVAKPESAITFKLLSESVKTIAHWIPVARTVLADVAQMRAYIDTRLIYGLKLTEEAQILYGNGVSPNLAGIMVNANIQNYSWSSGVVGDTKLDCIRRAMTLARVAEYPVTGIVLNPNDWEDIELLKGSDEHYIWIVVTEGGVPRVFRVPVVDTTAIVSGEALIGAYQLGAMLWDREDSNIRVAEQHEDFFIKNQVLILAEERLALTTFRPQGFVKINFDSAPIGS